MGESEEGASPPTPPPTWASSPWAVSTGTSSRASTPPASAPGPPCTSRPSSSTSPLRCSSSPATPPATTRRAHRAPPHPARHPQRRGALQAAVQRDHRVRWCAAQHPRRAPPQEVREEVSAWPLPPLVGTDPQPTKKTNKQKKS